MIKRTLCVGLIALALLLSTVHCQRATRPFRCHKCALTPQPNCDISTCNRDQTTCQTIIRTINGEAHFEKSCAQHQSCEDFESQNRNQCPDVCVLCCDTNLCNEGGPETCNCEITPHTHEEDRDTAIRPSITKPPAPCRNPRHFFRNVDIFLPMLLCGKENFEEGHCISSVPYTILAASKNYVLIHFVEDEVKFESCRIRGNSSKNSSLRTDIELRCVESNHELEHKLEESLEQLMSEKNMTNHPGLNITCMLESDDPNVDESEKFCGEINYQCNFTFTPPTASEPAVRQSEAAQAALPEGAIIALAVVGAGLLVAIVLFNVVRKVQKKYQSKVKPKKKKTKKSSISPPETSVAT